MFILILLGHVLVVYICNITDNTKDATLPQADILSVHNEAFVPNHEDYEALYADFKVLIQRALVEHIPALKDYHDLVEFHIPHHHHIS
jgi:hypothetical protein